MKICPKCKKNQHTQEFYYLKKHERLDSWCKACRRQASLRNYYDNSLADQSNARRRAKLKHRYGIDDKTKTAMRTRQSGCCGICGTESPLGIDHSHETGVVRGLLCHGCNTALGLFKDDTERLKRAAMYLERQ